MRVREGRSRRRDDARGWELKDYLRRCDFSGRGGDCRKGRKMEGMRGDAMLGCFR